VNFGSDDAAQPVTRMHLSGAAIPYLIQEFHLSGVFLAYVAQIQAQNGVALHATAAETQQSGAEMRLQFFRLQIARETILRFDQGNVFSQTSRHAAQLEVLTGLDAKQHLAHKVSQGLAEAHGELGGELGELRFQARPNFAMLHRGRLHGRSGFFGENPSTTDSVPSHFSKTINH